MKNKELLLFISKMIIFSLPIIITICYVEYNLNYITNSYSVKKEHLEQQSENIEVLVTGSSHSLYGVNPVVFPMKGYNIANVGQTLYYDSNIIKRYIDSLPKINTVIVEISHFTFLNDDLSDSPENWRQNFYTVFWKIPPIEPKFDLKNHSKIALYTSESVIKSIVSGFSFSLAKNFQNTGWGIKKYNLKDENLISPKSGLKKVTHHERVRTKNYVEYNKMLLADLVKILTDKRINIIFLSPPVYKTYYSVINEELYATNRKIVNELASKYNILYLDLMKSELFDKEYFRDNDHLNQVGATKLSCIISNYLVHE